VKEASEAAETPRKSQCIYLKAIQMVNPLNAVGYKGFSKKFMGFMLLQRS